jgi:hypothetical protein
MGEEVQVRITRLDAAVQRLDAAVAELGTQLAVLRWRVDRIMDGTANALTDAAARTWEARARCPRDSRRKKKEAAL